MEYTARNLRRDKVDVANRFSQKTAVMDRVRADIHADDTLVGVATFVLMWSHSRGRMYPGDPREHGPWIDDQLRVHLRSQPHLSDSIWIEDSIQAAVDCLVQESA